MADVGAVILAAGASSRFGSPKQLIKFGGRSLVDNVVNAAKRGGCWPVVVVTGSDSANVVGAINDDSICIAENNAWSNGIGSSIRTGVQRLIELAPQVKAVVLLVCDQPFVTTDVIRTLIESWATNGKTIIASSYSNTLGVPALFDCSCFGELLQIEDEQGAKRVILADQARVSPVQFPEGAWDIDTMEDYKAVARRKAKGAERATASQPPNRP